jgi:hypothetical protein
MAEKKPLALYNGAVKELQSGDTVAGVPAISAGNINHVRGGGAGGDTITNSETLIGSVTITPTDSSSAIVLIARADIVKDSGTTRRTVTVRIKRGSTQIGEDSVVYSQNIASTQFGPAVVVARDASHGVTTAVQYDIYAVASAASSAVSGAWEIIAQEQRGPKGDTGAAGSNGVGVPVGGTTGQVLAKIDGTDYNTEWVTPSGGGGGTILSPSTITGWANDYSPSSWGAGVAILRIESDGFYFLTGLAATSSAHIVRIFNTGNYPVGLFDNSTDSTAANRFDFNNQEAIVLPGQTVEIFYDGADSRWKLASNYQLKQDSPLVATYVNDGYVVSNNSEISRSGFEQWVGTGTRTEGFAGSYNGRAGVVELSTTTGSTNRAFHFPTMNNMLGGTTSNSQYLEYYSIFRTPENLSDATDRYLLQMGFADSVTGASVDGVFLYYDDATNSGQWVLRGYNNSATADVNSSIAVTANTWICVRVVILPNQRATAWINGVWIGGYLSSTAVPAANRDFSFSTGIRKTAGTSARVVIFDKAGVNIVRATI